MLRKIIFSITLIALSFFAFDVHPSWAEKMDKSEPHDIRLPLEQLLPKIGIQLDCYFTIERSLPSAKPIPSSWLGQVRIPVPRNISTVEELLSELRSSIPGVIILRRKENPQVIHIIEANVMQLNEHLLENPISVSHDGKLSLLTNELQIAANGSLITRNWRPTSFFYYDNSSYLSFEAQNKSLRSVVTDYLPLSQYHRVLWIAETWKLGQKPETWIDFHGPRNLEPLDTEARLLDLKIPINFSEGELAYAANPFTAETIKSALDFIAERMKSGQTRQVRWAMLFLGKHKVESGIPTLLKYLDYEYTPVPVLTERYPAYHALQMIGQPAAEAVLRALPSETNALKLELLQRVALDVWGADEGQKKIETVIAAIQDEEQRERVQATLQQAKTPVAIAFVPSQDKEAAPESPLSVQPKAAKQ